MSFQSSADIEEALTSGAVSVRDLYAIWEQREPVPEAIPAKGSVAAGADAPHIAWLQENLSLAHQFTKRALEKEEFLLVCDMAREALRLLPDADPNKQTELVRVRIDYARALTRLGFTRDARRELEPCAGDSFQPKLDRSLKADVLLQLGHIVREESHQAASSAERFQTADEALDFYRRALALEPERLEALISTAGAAFITGDLGPRRLGQAKEQARQILALTAQRARKQAPTVEMVRARAIASVILGDTEAAAENYGALRNVEGVKTSDLADARFYARYLAEALGKPRDFFKRAFPPLQLIVFSGHLPDPTKTPVRFPASSIALVRERLKKKLADADARVGMVSASAGADLLFIEALRARDGDVHVILPWSRDEFRRTSVKPFDFGNRAPLWTPLFDKAMKHAATIRTIGQVYEPGSPIGWQYLMEVTAGIALNTARASRLDVRPMVLWDGQPGRGAGGTESFLSFWQSQLQEEAIVVKLPPVRFVKGKRFVPRSEARLERAITHQEVKSMLFGDIVGYSKLTEQVIPEFVDIFLNRLSQLAACSKHPPRHLNTWGDAIYAVFDFAHEAGAFALELTQMIKEGESDWLQKGLYWEERVPGEAKPVKRPLSIRTALHTGPVFVHYNPVLRQLGFTGSHVSRAARIEPVTKAGEVFASEEFAALAELDAEITRRNAGGAAGTGEEGGARFVCDYAGSMQLAKSYPGRFRIYRVLPKRVFAIEELAKTAHDLYLVEARARGETRETNVAIRPWEELPEDLKDANRAQVADIPNKLRRLGYELAPSHGLPASAIKKSDAQVEALAIREHDRWMNDRLRHGWTFALERDNLRKHHPLLVPWDELSEVEKDKDRDTIRNLPRLIQKAGFRVRKLAEPSA